MSKNVAMFVDVANMYYAARGQDVDVDYVALLKHATKGRDLIRAYAYTGLDPENENQRKFIDFLGKNGYKPVVKDIRKFGDGRMKANLDIELVVDLFRLADRMDIAVIVSGDGDFAPAIRALQDQGIRAEVISFKPNTSSDLIAVADVFTDIMKIASISRKEGRALRDAMPTPEMPAKEVNPEFGFRDASPSVAAAALAALKGGGSGTNGRRTRGGSGRGRTAAPSDDVPAETTTLATAPSTQESEEGTRRRRRRRGGRGRGRGRREETELDSVPGGSSDAEVGWEELDDLSQVDGLEEGADEREYTFEEADANTLAELGIDAGAITSGEAESEADSTEEKPKRRSTRSRKTATTGDADATEDKPKRRSTRSRTTAASDGDADADADATEDKPKRRSTRSRKTASTDGDAAGTDADAAEAKPKRRSTRAKKADAAPAADSSEGTSQASADGDEPQGIWGRFRSARKPRATAS